MHSISINCSKNLGPVGSRDGNNTAGSPGGIEGGGTFPAKPANCPGPEHEIRVCTVNVRVAF